MAEPFTFPPPPPPPSPKHDSSNNVNTATRGAGYGGFRGRGGFRGSQQGFRGSGSRGRGRGYGSSNRAGDTLLNSRASVPNPRSTQTQEQRVPEGKATQFHLNPSQKRTHEKAFKPEHRPANHQGRPLAPPAVPSFGVDLDLLLAKKSDVNVPSKASVQKKGNSLGLTPAATEDESEVDDEDEEARLADHGTNSDLQFEYKGQTSSLRTAAEVAAWLAERRKRWPTQDRVEAARKEAEERRRMWEVEKQKKLDASREASRLRQEQQAWDRRERETAKLRRDLLARHVSKVGIATGANGENNEKSTGGPNPTSKAEKLRLKALRTSEKLKALESALQEAEAEPDQGDNDESDLEQLLAKVDEAAHGQIKPALADDDSIEDSSEDTEEIEETSSSGSSASDFDTDSAPEEMSSKLTGPQRVPAPPRNKSTSQPRTPCRTFAKLGRCKRGNKCRYLHERPDKNSRSGNGPVKRKPLYQVMVEKEQEEERKQALKAIISLGERGLLDDDSIDSKKDNT